MGSRRTAPIITTTSGTHSEAFGSVEWGLVAAIAGMWGSSFLLIDIGLEAFRPGLVALLQIAFGAAALSLLPGARRRVPREDLPRIAVLGAIWIAIPPTLIAVAQQWVASSAAGMILGGMPLFAGLIAALLLRRLPGRLQVLGLLVGFAGVVIVSLVVAEGGSSTILGVILLLVATALTGLSVNVAVPLQQRYGALPVIWRAELSAVVLVLPYGLISISGSTFELASFWAAVVLGLGATGLGFALMTILAGRAGATRGAVAVYFLPVVATLLGVAFRDESVGAAASVGLALIVAGASFTSRREALPSANGERTDGR